MPLVALVLVGLTLAGWLLLEGPRFLRARSEDRGADRGSFLVLRLTTAAGFLAAGVVTLLVPAAAVPTSIAWWLALVLLWAGIALRAWSFRALGRFFTFRVQTSSEQEVVTDGPYRWVRHPGYLGMVLALLGAGALLANWLALLALAVPMLAGLAYRVQVEESAMEAEMGDRWRSYAAGRARLVPFLW